MTNDISAKILRVYAMIYRSLLTEHRNVLRIIDFFYWPALDIIVWGFMGTWMDTTSSQPHVTLILLTGLALWQITMRSSYEISVALIEELWNRSLINLFATPLTMAEWIIAMMIMGIAKSFAMLGFCAGAIYLFYGINIFVIGAPIWMMFAILIIFGWVIGFMGGSMIIYGGQRVQSLPWWLAFIFMPLSAVYFPLSVLPAWMQAICAAVPASYVFEQLRSIATHGTYDQNAFMVAGLLTAIYLVVTLVIYMYCFKKSLQKGLARLE